MFLTNALDTLTRELGFYLNTTLFFYDFDGNRIF